MTSAIKHFRTGPHFTIMERYLRFFGWAAVRTEEWKYAVVNTEGDLDFESEQPPVLDDVQGAVRALFDAGMHTIYVSPGQAVSLFADGTLEVTDNTDVVESDNDEFVYLVYLTGVKLFGEHMIEIGVMEMYADDSVPMGTALVAYFTPQPAPFRSEGERHLIGPDQLRFFEAHAERNEDGSWDGGSSAIEDVDINVLTGESSESFDIAVTFYAMFPLGHRPNEVWISPVQALDLLAREYVTLSNDETTVTETDKVVTLQGVDFSGLGYKMTLHIVRGWAWNEPPVQVEPEGLR